LKYYIGAFRKYAVFSGRATRSEYWFFVLFNGIVTIALAVIAAGASLRAPMHHRNVPLMPAQLPILVYYVVALLPSLAVLVRRLHDTGRSGWWVFGAFLAGVLMAFSNAFPSYALVFAIPAFLLSLIILAFTIQDSEHEANRYGPNPK
jgi:uncharacterized membrane protein YhaH (DUF805 family)